MLDLNRIESGRLALSLESIDVNQMVRDAVEEMGVISDTHSFTVALDPSVGIVEADRDRLTQVLTNLLSNTVKYSPNGGEVKVRTELRDALVQVSVSDQGVGIPEAALERVFERFSRIEHPDTSSAAGTGLGLAIVKEIVELHGGHVWAESQPEEGTTFHFTIPQSGASGELAGTASQRPTPDKQKGTSDGC
jgi:signal transduction histidine kinase